jgi:RHS repeat-associated protein
MMLDLNYLPGDPEQLERNDNRKFTAREDDGTGLYYYRARYYHPGLGRFISEDPIGYAGGDINLYGYVGNSPIASRDAMGLQTPAEVISPLVVGVPAGFQAATGAGIAGEILGPSGAFGPPGLVVGGGVLAAILVGPEVSPWEREMAAREAAEEEVVRRATDPYLRPRPLPKPDYNKPPKCEPKTNDKEECDLVLEDREDEFTSCEYQCSDGSRFTVFRPAGFSCPEKWPRQDPLSYP